MNKNSSNVLTTIKDLGIIRLYSNEENGCYGNIYNSISEVLTHFPNANVLEGFGIIELSTGYCHPDSMSWYDSEEEAISAAKKLID